MDAATKGFWQKVVHELEHLNKTLDKLLQMVDGPRQEGEPSPSHTYDAENKAQTTSGQVSFPLHIRPAPEHHPKSNQKWYKTFNGWKDRIEAVALGFAILYALVTCWIAYINFQQWQDVRHNFEVDERSWLKIDLGFPSLILGNPMMINSTYTNVGKSIITASWQLGVLEVLNASEAPSLDFKKHGGLSTQSSSPIYPNDHGPFAIIEGDSNGTPRPLDRARIDDLTSGNKYIAAFG